MTEISIFAIDIGSPRNFAWVGGGDLHGDDGEGLVGAIKDAFSAGRSVALGFECPLFIPVPHQWGDIGKARRGEDNRPWSAGAGATVTTYGLHEVAWILARLREGVDAGMRIAFSPERWLADNEPGLLLWEAFVSGEDKGCNHTDDARRAYLAFEDLMKRHAWDEARRVTVGGDAQSLNLAALAAEWAGWPMDAGERRKELLVVKPTKDVGARHTPVPSGKAT